MYRIRTLMNRLRPLAASYHATVLPGVPNANSVLGNVGVRVWDIQRCCVTKMAAEPFLNGTSSVYVEEMYESWLKDPNSVHKVRVVKHV